MYGESMPGSRKWGCDRGGLLRLHARAGKRPQRSRPTTNVSRLVTHDARWRESSNKARAISHHPSLRLKRPTPSTIECDTPTTAPSSNSLPYRVQHLPTTRPISPPPADSRHPHPPSPLHNTTMVSRVIFWAGFGTPTLPSTAPSASSLVQDIQLEQGLTDRLTQASRPGHGSWACSRSPW